MKRLSIIALVLLAACHPAADSPTKITLTSQTMTLPTETVTLPAEVLTVNCTACHSPEMILTQPKLKPEQWQAEVTKMRGAYKAQIAEKDDAKIVAALLALPNQK
ncbi:cytochrome C nitrite reductase [Sphingomonas sp. MMS24-J45]|uniref:cytochrome C nitrite reductase n=1 Tax=Sphingomonas sp. MMS24-J45 TaxID=3238806 RepID=UPI00384A5E1F